MTTFEVTRTGGLFISFFVNFYWGVLDHQETQDMLMYTLNWQQLKISRINETWKLVFSDYILKWYPFQLQIISI